MDKTNLFSAHRLDAVRVYGEQPGERTYTREQIAETPSSNRDLTSLVASHPAVRVNAGANGSQNRGSLDVEDLSFHGASPTRTCSSWTAWTPPTAWTRPART